MHPFEYIEAGSVEEAVRLCAGSPGESRLVAGGTDLLTEIKEGVIAPSRLIGIGRIASLHGVSETEDGLSIGAMTTITEIASHPVIQAEFTALSEAAAGLATPQIRNLGTLGGNLNQRPRCWYYRHPLTVCLKKGGDHCHALAGETKFLCVTGGSGCYSVHPSDTAVALLALDALVEVAGPAGIRILPIEQYFAGPSRNVTQENILGPGELLTRVYLQRPAEPDLRASGRSSLYLKAGEREGGDFALVSVAAVLSLNGPNVRRMPIVLGGVAPVPYRAFQVEAYFRGKPVAEVDAAHAASLALPNAVALAGNGYKIKLATNLVRRAIIQLLTSEIQT